METIVRKINPGNSENLHYNSDIALAGKIIREGGLVAFPTETVYGLGANALMPEAAKKIYTAKGRPSDNPLIVHICEAEQLKPLTKEILPLVYRLAERFWPGPLTLVLKKSGVIPYETSGGLDTVAIRMPSDAIARELIRQSGVPVAAPSANISGRPSPTKASHVAEDMGGKIEMILDGGSVGIGLESTIVDLTGEIPVLLRPGAVTVEMLEEVCGSIDIDPAIEHLLQPGERPKAPGMKYRHYAPKADMEIVRGSSEAMLDYIESFILKKTGSIAVIAIKEHLKYISDFVNTLSGADVHLLNIGSKRDMESVAHNLFDVLRKCDELDVDYILAEGFEETGIGKAVMNRLKKAAGYRITDIIGENNE